MQCVHPILLPRKHYRGEKQKKYETHIEGVPCGKCIACKINQSTEWADRLIHEYETNPVGGFVTLTYDDDHVKMFNGTLTLHEPDMQLWFKKLRWHLEQEGCSTEIKYFYCGEYGSETKRPHYHAIIIGVDIPTLRTLGNRLWKMCDPECYKVELICPESIRYVTGYISKAVEADTIRYAKEHGIQKPYQRMSKNIGLKWMSKNKKEIREKLSIITIEGAIHPLPRYYKKKLHITKNDYPDKTPDEFKKFHDNMKNAEQREKNLIAQKRAKGQKL